VGGQETVTFLGDQVPLLREGSKDLKKKRKGRPMEWGKKRSGKSVRVSRRWLCLVEGKNRDAEKQQTEGGHDRLFKIWSSLEIGDTRRGTQRFENR